ncbi:MAG: SNF2 helicase associated domain-containing protein, partial [Clostridia bacterium]|nr:SNF2 helicase associated domain-containing protein [Clostridia bacterium]
MESNGILRLVHCNLEHTIGALSSLNRNRGEAIYKSGAVLRCEIFNEGQKSLRVDAKVQGGVRTPYSVVLRFDEKGELTDRYCNCPAFAKSGTRGSRSGAPVCKHCAAVLFQMQHDIKSCRVTGAKRTEDPVAELEKLLGEYVPDAERKIRTDLPGARMIEKLERENTVSEMLPLVPRDLVVTPLLTFDRGDRFYLEFTVGNTRQYIVRDVVAFGRAYLNHGVIEFGKGLTVFFDDACFDERSRATLRFVASLSEREKQYSDRSAVQSPADARRIYVPNAEMGRFIDLYDGAKLSYRGLREGIKTVTVHNGTPPVTFRAEKMSDGIRLSHDLPPFRLAEDLLTPGLTVVAEGEGENADMYYASGRTGEILGAVLEAFRRNTNQSQLQFSSDAQSKLRRYVLPRLKNIGRLESNLNDSRGSRNRLKLKSEVYIDRVAEGQEMLTAEIKFRYGEYEFRALAKETSLAAARIPRDTVGEMKILYLLREKGFYNDAQGRMVLVGEERIYDFLSESISSLKPFAEVFFTDAVKRIGIRHPKAPTVRVRLTGGLLEMSVNGDLPREKIGEILSAYRDKKKYYRLEDGSFLALDEKNVGLLSELERNFDLDDEKLKNNEMTLLAYRGMYLSDLLKKYPGVEVSGNKAFRELTAHDQREAETPLDGKLRAYQKSGVRWLKGLADFGLGGILADEMGLGKTVQIIALLSIPQERKRPRPSIIVAPTSLVYNWKTEFARFAPDMAVTVVSGVVSRRHELIRSFRGDVLITSYDALKRDLEHYEKKQFRYVIIDEAQYIKNQRTDAAKCVKLISAKTRFASTFASFSESPPCCAMRRASPLDLNIPAAA